MGAIFYIVVWNLLMWFGMRYAYFKGYELGGKAVEILVGEQAQAIRDSIIMIGTIVIGAVAASWINISTALVLPGGGVLQQTLDGIYPKMLSALTVIFCWWLMTKRNVSPTMVMLLLVVVAFVGVLIGFFDPGLSY
jgi:mannose/fructose/N-acetylgalactosamine-specific phosphotransferase system component IID